MKKMLAMLLTLSLLLCVFAIAEDVTTTNSKTVSTELYYELQANETYTITIPSALSLSETADGLPAGYLNIKLDASNFNVPGKCINVSLAEAAFKLTNGDSALDYIIQYIDEASEDESLIKLNIGDVFIDWDMFDEDIAEQRLSINVTSMSSDIAAGKYSDKVTFAVKVHDRIVNQETE